MDRRIAATLVSVLALGVASCGGTEPKPTLTREQLVAKINLACSQAAKATAQQMRTVSGTTSSSDRAAYGAAIVAGQRLLEDGLTELNPSDAVKQDFEAFRKGIQQRLHVYEQMQAALRSGDENVSSDLQQQQTVLFRRLDDISHRWDLEGCI